MIDLSIIVPVYNVEKYIRSCIESIFMQSLDDANFEVIIVNDGTQDKSMEVILNSVANASKYAWLEFDAKALCGKFLNVPTREEIPENINEQLIVDLYSK